MSSPFIGEIRMVGFNFAQKGWAICSGALLSISQNQALFSLLGTTYGGNGVTTFALPNMQSRVPIFYGQGPGLPNYVIGETGGQETVTLTTNQIPAHNHALNATTSTATKRVPTGRMFAADNASIADYYAAPGTIVPLASQSMTNAGGSQAHSNVQPYTAVLFQIALQGIFPSRN